MSFASLVSSLGSLFMSWVESEEMQIVLGSVKGHEVWRVSEMIRSSLFRVEKWGGSKGVRIFL